MSGRSSRSNRKAIVPLPRTSTATSSQQSLQLSTSNESSAAIVSDNNNSNNNEIPTLAHDLSSSSSSSSSLESRETETRQMLSLSVLSSLIPQRGNENVSSSVLRNSIYHPSNNSSIIPSFGLLNSSNPSAIMGINSNNNNNNNSNNNSSIHHSSAVSVSTSSSSSVKCRGCNCKNSKCLKLYCECFASGIYCDACNCKQCHNNLEHDKERKQAIEATLERNPRAFKPKIAVTAATPSPKSTTISSHQNIINNNIIISNENTHESNINNNNTNSSNPNNNSTISIPSPASSVISHPVIPSPLNVIDDLSLRAIHHRGCHCKKSFCLKKYCECYQAGIVCSENCRCQDCKNFTGSSERQTLEIRQINAGIRKSITNSLTPTNNNNGQAVINNNNNININSPLIPAPVPNSNILTTDSSSSSSSSSSSPSQIHSDFVVDLSRSLLLAAHAHRGNTDNEQAVKDLLMLASPMNANNNNNNNNQNGANNSSVSETEQTTKRKRESETFTFNLNDNNKNITSENNSSSSQSVKIPRLDSSSMADDEPGSEDWRSQIKADALASVHRAIQQAAQHQASNNNNNNHHNDNNNESIISLPLLTPTISAAMKCKEEILLPFNSSSPSASLTSNIPPASLTSPRIVSFPSPNNSQSIINNNSSSSTDSVLLNEFGSYLRRLQSFAQRAEPVDSESENVNHSTNVSNSPLNNLNKTIKT